MARLDPQTGVIDIMVEHRLPIGLPDSLVLRELARKCALLRTSPARTPAYLEWLKTLRDRIAPELSYTNVTFPLFTPHDEQNHIHPLFVLTERLIGSEVIGSLNATELFVLACGLYAHDWGMAVSNAERRCLLGMAEPTAQDTFKLLEDDKAAFARLLREHRVPEDLCAPADVPLWIWQAYIRKTHAARSAQRARHFFSEIDANLGEAVALVSEGHNLDIERLRSFETALPLQGQSVNLRALALYLRLVDLCDLGQDRTPYALWKFVSPDDVKSAEEWNKHRALSPVVVEQFQETSRCIKVRGATDDHRVYAALEDLRGYCDNQLRLSNGLLNELESRYQPRLLHLDWKVEPKGFDPISVRFEFDRRAMIDVLSHEVYQEDEYVFLRELLQNSIDAIRLRGALHSSKNTGVKFDGEIRVKVEHHANGSAIVSWTDNGSGMSTFIVRNYLTVVGRSFYRSDDFQKLGVEMDPISRFGIGILSCFVVAERIEIVTRQDPQIEASAEALKIEIHNPERHLRIERCTSDRLPPVGTTVRVFVDSRPPDDPEMVDRLREVGEFVPSSKENDALDVTGYLKEIAGFVEFPIYVEEGARRTVILHPDRAGPSKNRDGWEVATLDRSFSWEDHFLPQDASRARSLFTEDRITIRPTEKKPIFEGTVSFPILNEAIELRSGHPEKSGTAEVYVAVRGSIELGKVRIRKRRGTGQCPRKYARSSDCDNMCRIYCDGILIAGVSPTSWARDDYAVGAARVVLNIRRATAVELDLSRHDMAVGGHAWSKFVRQRYMDHFRKKTKQIVGGKSLKETSYRLARLVSYNCLLSLWGGRDIVDDVAIPLLVLDNAGAVTLIESTALSSDDVRLLPQSLGRELSATVFEGWASRKWLQGRREIIPWSGGQCVLAEGIAPPYWKPVTDFRSAWGLVSLTEDWLRVRYDLWAVRFLSPGKREKVPLIQEIWRPRKAQKRKRCSKMGRLSGIGGNFTQNVWRLFFPSFCGIPKCAQFAAPFDDFFTAGWQYLNLDHHVAKALVECIQAVVDQRAAGALKEHDLGRIHDALRALFGDNRPSEQYAYLSDAQVEEVCEGIRRLFKLTSELGVFEWSGDLRWPSKTLNVPPVVKAGRLGAPVLSLREVGLE